MGNSMPKKIHNSDYCYGFKDKALPDEKGLCSLCGAEMADKIFEDDSIMLLKRGALYVLEPKGSRAYKTEFREGLEVGDK